MHPAAYSFISSQVMRRGPFVAVLEIGCRDINRSVRGLFDEHNTVYEGVDIVDGPGVDYVCDATVELPKGPYDAIVATEVFEHEAGWPRIVWNAYAALMERGVLLVTMAGLGRAPHSATDGGPLRPNEFYANVEPGQLAEALRDAGFVGVEVDESVPGDLYAAAVKGE